jgi:molecular chaperone DnaK
MTGGRYTLGIDLGTTFAAAAVDVAGRTQVVTLDHRSTVVPSVAYVGADGTTVVGAAAERRGAQDPERLARQIKRRVGDSVPLILGGVAVTAEGLMAALLAWVHAQVVEQRGGPPEAVAVTHPANWGAFKRERLADIIRLSGVGGSAEVVTLTEPEAAALSYAAAERVPAGEVVAVYDLGGGTFDASVLRKSATGFEVLGTPSGIEHLGGVDLDEAVFAHVVRTLGVDLDELPGDDVTLRAIARLRADCVDAKEALSADTEATLTVALPGVTGDVRITRAEMEAMVRPLLDQSATALRHAIASADLAPEDVDRVLLAGGSSRVPLVAEVVSGALGRPVALDAHPKHATALGAALAARAHVVAAGAPGDATAPTQVAVPAPPATVPVPPAPTLPLAAAAPPPPGPAGAVPGPPGAPGAPPAPGRPTVPQRVPRPQPVGVPGPAGPAPLATAGHAGGSPRGRVALVGAIVAAVLAATIVAVLAAQTSDDPPTSPAATGSTAATVTTTTGGTSTSTTTAAPTTTEPPATTTTRPDPEDVAVAGVTATGTAADGFDACETPTSFAPANVLDGLRDTAWRVGGDGTGQSLTFDLGSEQRVLVVGLVPGYDKVDACDGADRWPQNRRPTQVTWQFPDGTEVTQALEDTRELQTMQVDVEADSVVLHVDGVTGAPERDYTAISEVTLQGA